MITNRPSQKMKVAIACLVILALYLCRHQFFESIVGNRGVEPTSDNGSIKQREPQRHFVYIKIEKTGSTTLSGILGSYAKRNKLNLMSPIRNLFHIDITLCKGLGWGVGPYKNRAPDALLSHAVYRRGVTEKLFPSDSEYISLLRHPFSLFVSAAYYFNYKLTPIDGNSSRMTPESFMNNQSYWNIDRKPNVMRIKKLFHIPQLQWLGFNYDSHDTLSAVEEWIQFLTKRFPFMILTEHFDEGLVLLKRRMRWTLRDILYQLKVVGSYDKKASYSADFANEVLKFNYPDLLLYEQFNRTFWEQVSKELLFMSEVKFFKRLNDNVTSYCTGYSNGSMTVEDIVWGTFTFAKADCLGIGVTSVPKYSQVGVLEPRIASERLRNNFCNQSKIK